MIKDLKIFRIIILVVVAYFILFSFRSVLAVSEGCWMEQFCNPDVGCWWEQVCDTTPPPPPDPNPNPIPPPVPDCPSPPGSGPCPPGPVQTYPGAECSVPADCPDDGKAQYDSNGVYCGICSATCNNGSCGGCGCGGDGGSCNNNGNKDNGETGIDCGGGDCPACSGPGGPACGGRLNADSMTFGGSYAPGQGPINAFVDSASSWYSGISSTGAWIGRDYTSGAASLRRINAYRTASFTFNGPIQYSDDNSSWTSAGFSFSIPSSDSTWRTVDLPYLGNHRYWRVLDSQDDSYHQIDKLEFFDCAPPPLPDLMAGNTTPSFATAGVLTELSSLISNVGTGSTGVSFSNFFQIASAPNGTGTITDLAPASMSVLSVNTSALSKKDYTFPASGSYSVRACTDKTSSAGGGVVAESNEDNNCSSSWTTVTVTPSTTACNNGVDVGLRFYQDGIRKVAVEPGAAASPLRIYKDGVRGVVLVDPSNPNASRMRIQTASGVKTLCLLP